jgi:hypothetical protein
MVHHIAQGLIDVRRIPWVKGFFRSPSLRYRITRTRETLGCRHAGRSGGTLWEPSSTFRLFSANRSAAKLFEKVAITGPFASPSLT